MKYFLTGATGFVGGRLARQLVEAGHQVVAVVRDLARAKGLADPGIAVHQGDVTDKESMRAPMTGVDGVFHVAAWYKVGVKDKREAEARGDLRFGNWPRRRGCSPSPSISTPRAIVWCYSQRR